MLNNIDWLETRKKIEWKQILCQKTLEALTVSDKVELSQYNESGYFHHVYIQKDYEEMRNQWEVMKVVPQNWIVKGHFPGIWSALFNPHNTYRIAHPPVSIVRFYFKPGYYIFDKENPRHKEILKNWQAKNKPWLSNPWDYLANSYVESMRDRMETHGYPYSKKFFEDNHFGAFIGYSDYIAAVIALEDSVERVEFSTIDRTVNV